MRIAKPILLVTTPVGVVWGMVEAYQAAPGLAVLMGALIGVICVAAASVVTTIRREQREERERNAASRQEPNR